MLYDLEERVEDAFVAYLQANATGDMKVYPAWTDEEIEYPCAVVRATNSDMVTEDSEHSDIRAIAVEVAIISEASPERDDDGNTIRTTRERNAAIRTDIMQALSTSLKTNLIAAAGPGVAFSMAQMGGPITREVDDAHRAFITTVPVDVIAEPKEAA